MAGMVGQANLHYMPFPSPNPSFSYLFERYPSIGHGGNQGPNDSQLENIMKPCGGMEQLW